MPGILTPYHRAIIRSVALYYVLLRTDIQELCCPNDRDGRVTRKRIGQVVEMGFVGKCRMEVVSPADREAPMPAYYPTRKGLEFLAADSGDESWLLKSCQTPNWQHLRHWNAVAKWHILLDRAASRRPDAVIGGWAGEWDRIPDPKGGKPEDTFMLYTVGSEKPRVVATPDAAFLVCAGDRRWICYLEIDRETSGVNQICASKPPGYSLMHQRKLHRRHFDTNADEFRVLSVSYTAGRRDLLVKAMRGKPAAELWRFSAWPELTPETLLYAPVWHRVDGEAGPLVKTAGGPVSAANPGSGPGPEGGPAVVRPGPQAGSVLR
jgi:hypothetical protein